MEQRMKDQMLGAWFSTKPGFAKWKRLNPLVKKFYLHIKIGRRGEQISATHRRGLEEEPPAAGGYRSPKAKHPAAGRFFVSFWKKWLFK